MSSVKEEEDMQTQTPSLPQPKKLIKTVPVQAELPAELVKKLDAARGTLTRKSIIQFGVEYWLSQKSKQVKKPQP